MLRNRAEAKPLRKLSIHVPKAREEKEGVWMPDQLREIFAKRFENMISSMLLHGSLYPLQVTRRLTFAFVFPRPSYFLLAISQFTYACLYAPTLTKQTTCSRCYSRVLLMLDASAYASDTCSRCGICYGGIDPSDGDLGKGDICSTCG